MTKQRSPFYPSPFEEGHKMPLWLRWWRFKMVVKVIARYWWRALRGA